MIAFLIGLADAASLLVLTRARVSSNAAYLTFATAASSAVWIASVQVVVEWGWWAYLPYTAGAVMGGLIGMRFSR